MANDETLNLMSIPRTVVLYKNRKPWLRFDVHEVIDVLGEAIKLKRERDRDAMHAEDDKVREEALDRARGTVVLHCDRCNGLSEIPALGGECRGCGEYFEVES